MKNRLFLHILTLCLFVSPLMTCCTNAAKWEDRPLGQASAAVDKGGKTKKRSLSEFADKKKSALFEHVVAWCKKPGVKYLAGAVLSAALGTYAVVRCMRGEVDPIALPEPTISTSNDIVGTPKNEDSVNISLDDSANKKDNDTSQDMPFSDDNDKDKSIEIDNQDEDSAFILKTIGCVIVGSGIGLMLGTFLAGKYPWP